jgi:hypothetical protein
VFAGTTYRVGDCVALRPEDEADDWYAIIDELYEVPLSHLLLHVCVAIVWCVRSRVCVVCRVVCVCVRARY